MSSTFQFFGVNSPTVAELFTLMVAKYKDALAQRPKPWARSICGFTSTAELRQKFPIDLTALDGFREWVGERDAKDADLTAFYIDSKPWERTIDVPLDDVKPANFAQYVNKVPNLIRAASAMPNKLVATMLAAGKTFVGWDAANFFSTTHPVDLRGLNTSAQWSNLHTAMPFNRANFQLARQYARALKAPDGVTPLGLEVKYVLGGTEQEDVFDALFLKAILANDAGTAADTNIFLKAATPIIGAELDKNNEPGVWYTILGPSDGGTDLNPFELQWANDGAPDIKIFGDGSEFAALKNKLRFGGKLFGNAGYAIPHCIQRFEPS